MSKTLLTLLLLNRSLREVDRRPRIVTELFDARDVDLAVVTGADDFVVSDALASYMMAQLAERAELHGPVPFADIVASAAASGEVALGYRVTATNAVGVTPAKSATVALADDDAVILIGPV